MSIAAPPSSKLEKSAIGMGINLAGYLTAESGVAEAARGYVAALQKAGFPLALNNFEVGVTSRKTDGAQLSFAQNNPYGVNIVCVNADQIPAFVQHFGAQYFKDRYNIAVWWWELPDFPPEVWESFSWFDEIWVGSSFVQQSLSFSSPLPVVTIPPVVEVRDSARKFNRAHYQLPEGEFLFLYMFDFLSGFERKNPLALARSFKQAFGARKDVRLVLKTINSDKGEHRKDFENILTDCNYTIIDTYFSADETVGLINVCDAYVSLHRSEGLGIPLVQAMMLGKPVVATAWSSVLDFMTPSNSCMVGYKLKVNDVACGPYKVGEVWAEPDERQAAALMLQLLEDGKKNVIGKTAQQDVGARYGVEAIAARIQERFTAIKHFRHGQMLVEKGVETQSLRPSQLDEPLRRQLQIIKDGSDNAIAGSASKSFLRRLVMPIVERAGYLGSIYAQLFERLFAESARDRTRLNLVEQRTRRLLAEADGRIRALEREVEKLRQEQR